MPLIKKNTNAVTPNKWEKVKVGSPIAVYWDEDKCYYACEVLKKKGSEFLLKYEDDGTEWRTLSKSVFRWQDDEPSTDDETSEEENEEASEDEDVPKRKTGVSKFIDDEAVEVNGDEEDEGEESEYEEN